MMFTRMPGQELLCKKSLFLVDDTSKSLIQEYSKNELPAMLAYATTANEVSNLVKCGQTTGYQVVPRSGGHQ
jgi:hypothetical protein